MKLFFALPHPFSLFFLFYSIGQALFEVTSFALILLCIQKWGWKWMRFGFIALSFILCLVHFTDFTLIRLMDAPISYMFKFLFCSGFLKVLQALNLNTSMMVMIGCTVVIIPLLGPLCYWLTNLYSKRKVWKVSIVEAGAFLSIISVSLFALDLTFHPFLNRPNYAKMRKALPFKWTFLSPSPRCITLDSPLAAAREEREVHSRLPQLSTSSPLPNIYFFVIETLRRDFLTEETAPHMSAFAEKNCSFPLSFANSNGTHLSWFAIFHSTYPWHWTQMKDSWSQGSIPLQMLKNLGYRIVVYTSADLRYFDMDRLIFGEKRQLIDKIEEYAGDHGIEPCERDAKAMQAFAKDLEQGKEGTVYLFFFDSTHSEYSFPKDFPLYFEPIVPQIDYLTLTEKEIEPIKNRYRNSIRYVDELVGNFLELLKKKELYQEAIIAITGDHGEEFFEEGALFHGTHLNHFQTHVPIFCKFPKTPIEQERATHMDLFPSILHALTGQEYFSELFDGESLFSSHRWPYRVAVLQNGSLTPREFAITGKNKRCHLRFLSGKNIYRETKLELIDFDAADLGTEDLSCDQLFDTFFPEVWDSLSSNISVSKSNDFTISLGDDGDSGE